MLENKLMPYHYRWSFSVNSAPCCLREQVAYWLRRLADRIDGRISLSIRIQTEPEISTRSLHDCIMQGMAAIKRSIELETRAEALEKISSRLCPELWRSTSRHDHDSLGDNHP